MAFYRRCLLISDLKGKPKYNEETENIKKNKMELLELKIYLNRKIHQIINRLNTAEGNIKELEDRAIKSI